MNLAFLGDALDHWKGSLFESLQDAKIFRKFAVDPMASDFHRWEQQDFDLFASLLRVNREQVLQHSISLGNRQAYFQEISHTGDLFIDPDTGVATGNVREPEKYVMPTEIGQLLNDKKERILAVYQHVRAQRVSNRVDSVLSTINRHIGKFTWSSYESGTVAMLFLSRCHNRADDVAKHFKTILGRHAEGRIRQGLFS